jgi:predicted molibdopterin-dependent oxidoreductase YjgC
VNVVTSSECDEDTMCPEYKVVAVEVERVGAREKREEERVAVARP